MAAALPFEEYEEAAVFMTGKIQQLRFEGLPAYDHLIAKWYIAKILPTSYSRSPEKQMMLQAKYISALRRMVHDGLLRVEATTVVGSSERRGCYCGLNLDAAVPMCCM
eukprot:Polyplicarium_translucidae@DN3305_c0_g2_i4.p1